MADAAVSATVSQGVTVALQRQDVPIAYEDVSAATPKVAAAVIAAIDASPTSAIVPVTSAWTSKINITQVATALIALAVGFGIPISDSMKVNILTLVGIVGPGITAVLKTFFTKSITAASK